MAGVFDPEDALPRKKRCWRLNVSRRQAIDKVRQRARVGVEDFRRPEGKAAFASGRFHDLK